jgi:hypothetical protein
MAWKKKGLTSEVQISPVLEINAASEPGAPYPQFIAITLCGENTEKSLRAALYKKEAREVIDYMEALYQRIWPDN